MWSYTVKFNLFCMRSTPRYEEAVLELEQQQELLLHQETALQQQRAAHQQLRIHIDQLLEERSKRELSTAAALAQAQQTALETSAEFESWLS